MNIKTLTQQMNLDKVSAVMPGEQDVKAESQLTIEAGSNEGFYLTIADHSLRIHGSRDEALTLLREAYTIIQSTRETTTSPKLRQSKPSKNSC